MNELSFILEGEMARVVDKEAKRRTILEAAAKVFAEKGFYQARISDISSEAGVADGTIYIYYDGKDELLISIFEEQMNYIINRLKDKLKDIPDPQEKIKAFINEHFKMVEEFPDYAGVITVELRQSNKFMKEYKNEKFKEYLEFVADIIDYGKDKGIVPLNLNSIFAARALFGLLDELTLMWILAKKKPPIKELADTAWTLISRGLFGHGQL